MACFIVFWKTSEQLTLTNPAKNESFLKIGTPEFSYLLYLPKDYSPNVSYPLIFCLSPSGNGEDFSYLSPITSEYDIILAVSNDFANYKPLKDYLPKINKSLNDIEAKFNIDKSKIYACGFSGGGMGVYVISYFKPNYFKGLIINNGALHQNLYNIEMLKRMGVEKVVLICGKKDSIVPCSYIKNDEKWLKKAGIKTKVIEFDGGHQLAPLYVYEEAIGWVGKIIAQ